EVHASRADARAPGVGQGAGGLGGDDGAHGCDLQATVTGRVGVRRAGPGADGTTLARGGRYGGEVVRGLRRAARGPAPSPARGRARGPGPVDQPFASAKRCCAPFTTSRYCVMLLPSSSATYASHSDSGRWPRMNAAVFW